MRCKSCEKDVERLREWVTFSPRLKARLVEDAQDMRLCEQCVIDKCSPIRINVAAIKIEDAHDVKRLTIEMEPMDPYEQISLSGKEHIAVNINNELLNEIRTISKSFNPDSLFELSHFEEDYLFIEVSDSITTHTEIIYTCDHPQEYSKLAIQL